MKNKLNVARKIAVYSGIIPVIALLYSARIESHELFFKVLVSMIVLGTVMSTLNYLCKKQELSDK